MNGAYMVVPRKQVSPCPQTYLLDVTAALHPLRNSGKKCLREGVSIGGQEIETVVR